MGSNPTGATDMMLCAHCLREVFVPLFAAWPQACPRCYAAPFALISLNEIVKDGMSEQGPERGETARTTQGHPAGRGSRVIPIQGASG